MICFLGAPVAGVMIADYWIVGKGRPESWHKVDGWNWTGCIVAVVSMVIALLFIQRAAHRGFLSQRRGCSHGAVRHCGEVFPVKKSRKLDGGTKAFAEAEREEPANVS